MPYRPPSGWVEQVSTLERENYFHEDEQCPEVSSRQALVAVDRPGRSRQCKRCVLHTALAELAADSSLFSAASSPQ